MITAVTIVLIIVIQIYLYNGTYAILQIVSQIKCIIVQAIVIIISIIGWLIRVYVWLIIVKFTTTMVHALFVSNHIT